jgi:hypothetical protein
MPVRGTRHRGRKVSDGYGTVPLFELDRPELLVPKQRPAPAPRVPKWSPLVGKTTGLACDDCVALHLEMAVAPLSRRTKWRRADGVTERYLCDGHAATWRAEDGYQESDQ